MKTILTPSQIYTLLFSAEENYNPSAVRESDIAIAESRYLLPIVGESLYNALLNSDYAELRDDYVAPMLGAWTRYIVEPLLAERCGFGHGATVADAELMARLKLMRLYT